MKIKRSKLVEGRQYFMDARKDIKGVFKGRSGDSIYFECEENARYALSARRVGLTAFSDDDIFGGFLEVVEEDNQ